MKTLSILIAATLFAACAAQDPYDSGEADDNDAKADSSTTRPAGRFASDGNGALQAGMFTELTLNADKTFGGHEFTYCTSSPTGEFVHCGYYHGTYKFTKSTTTTATFMRFYDESGNFVGRFQYKLSGTKLQMKPMESGGTWTTIGGISTKTFVADAKDAYVNTKKDEFVTVTPDNAPAAAQDAFEKAGTSSHRELLRFDADGMSVYALHTFLTDASWVSLFDETGNIANGGTNFTGKFSWQ